MSSEPVEFYQVGSFAVPEAQFVPDLFPDHLLWLLLAETRSS